MAYVFRKPGIGYFPERISGNPSGGTQIFKKAFPRLQPVMNGPDT
jgi:hypothetical protein